MTPVVYLKSMYINIIYVTVLLDASKILLHIVEFLVLYGIFKNNIYSNIIYVNVKLQCRVSALKLG